MSFVGRILLFDGGFVTNVVFLGVLVGFKGLFVFQVKGLLVVVVVVDLVVWSKNIMNKQLDANLVLT